MPVPEPSAPWYSKGLRFSCTQCGNCCTGEPGFTWVSPDEIARLAARLGIEAEAFCRRYTREVWRKGENRRSLIDTRDNACVFYAAGTGCTVYTDRPRQCRTWPFWRSNLRDAQDWESASRECPGMGSGALHPAAEITATMDTDGLP